MTKQNAPGMTEEDKLRGAISLAVGSVGRWSKDGVIDIPDIDPKLAWVTDAFVPIYRRRGDVDHDWPAARRRLPHNEELLGFDLEPVGLTELISGMRENRRVYDYVARRVAYNAIKGFCECQDLRHIASEIITGDLSRPPIKKHGGQSALERNSLLRAIVERVKERFKIQMTREDYLDVDLKPTPCGAMIAWSAFSAFGYSLTEDRAYRLTREAGDLKGISVRYPALTRPDPILENVNLNALRALGDAYGEAYPEQHRIALERFGLCTE